MATAGEADKFRSVKLPLSIRMLGTRLARPISVKIAAGPNAGERWSLAVSGRHRKGTWEPARVAVLEALVRPGDCVWDVGAHHGYVALLASRLAGDAGRVYAFEPSPYNLAFLRTHLRWSGRTNVTVVPRALSDRDGEARFVEGGSSQTFRIGDAGRAVEAVSIATLLADGVRPPDVLKLDTEGSEGRILAAGADRLPPTCRALVSIHSRSNHAAATAALRAAGFALVESPTIAALLARDLEAWPKDPDVLALGPESGEDPERWRAMPYFGGGSG